MIALLCTDGSEPAIAALRAGLALLGEDRVERLVLATAVDEVDPMLVVGTGTAGGLMTPDEADDVGRRHLDAGRADLDATSSALGLDDVETTILTGRPGPSICELAATLPADVVVLGSRGRGGVRRAVLGSVSDHVVRNAPCPVVTVTTAG